MVERPETLRQKTPLIALLRNLQAHAQPEVSVDWDTDYSRNDRQPVSESTSRRPGAFVLVNRVLSRE